MPNSQSLPNSRFHILTSLLVIVPAILLSPALVNAQDITTGLVGHWKFDEGSGIVAGDSSGNNNSGTLT